MNRQIMKLFKYLLAVLLCIPGTTFATGYCARIPYTMSGGKMVVKAEINGKQGELYIRHRCSGMSYLFFCSRFGTGDTWKGEVSGF